jgi:hypothetical protein
MARFVWLAALLGIALAGSARSAERTLEINPKQAMGAEMRHALVIGNSAYAHGPLRNPVNDARAISKALGEAGFKVTLVEDATEAGMVRAIRIFGANIAKGGVGLFYFAGHGIQARGRNYLVPVNADIAHEEEIEFNTVDVNLVLAKMDAAKNGLNIVILDACRNNPFARSFRSTQAGLAQIDAPTGTFIAFATAPGSVAADGAAENGVYTKHLLAELGKPGVPIEQLFKQVRNGVMRETGNLQIPWESSSLRGDFAFRPALPSTPSVDPVEALRREREAQRLEMEKMLQATLDQQRRQSAASDPTLVEIAFWDSVKASADASDFRAYLEQYPGGRFAVLAKNRLAALERKPAAGAPTVVASAQPLPPRAIKAPAEGDTWTYEIVQRDQPGLGKGRYTVTVNAASADAISETFQMRNDGARQWTHTREPAMLGLGVSMFSPYPALLGDMEPGTRLQVENLEQKLCGPGWNCQLSARVMGYEKVKVPAGTFQAIKVQIAQNWTSPGQTNDRGENISRTIHVWYAPEVKRAVKYSSRGEMSAYVDTNFELQLLSFKLK